MRASPGTPCTLGRTTRRLQPHWAPGGFPSWGCPSTVTSAVGHATTLCVWGTSRSVAWRTERSHSRLHRQPWITMSIDIRGSKTDQARANCTRRLNHTGLRNRRRRLDDQHAPIMERRVAGGPLPATILAGVTEGSLEYSSLGNSQAESRRPGTRRASMRNALAPAWRSRRDGSRRDPGGNDPSMGTAAPILLAPLRDRGSR